MSVKQVFFILPVYLLVVLVVMGGLMRRTLKSGESPEGSLEFIRGLNNQQRIYNRDLYGDEAEFVIVVQVHKRPQYLQKLIQSLQNTPQINTTLLIFSHDWMDESINAMVQNIKFAKVMQLFYPYLIQVRPDKFPGLELCPQTGVTEGNCSDSYGNLRNPFLAQIKHHWWWKANFVFKEIKVLSSYAGAVLFLEEDHYVAPDFLHCLKMMINLSHHICPSCWFYSLGIKDYVDFEVDHDRIVLRKVFENLGLAFNRSTWNRISQYREHFCKFDDYNWDWSLRHLYREVSEHESSMVLLASRVLHIGLCGTHYTSNASCNAIEEIAEFEGLQAKLFPQSFRVYETELENNVDFMNNGGWGDHRDQELCLSM